MGSRLVLEGLRQAGEGLGAFGAGLGEQRRARTAEEDRQRLIDEQERVKMLRGEIFSPTTTEEMDIQGPPDIDAGEESLTAEVSAPSLLGQLRDMSQSTDTTREEFSAKAGEYLAQAAASGDPTTINSARNIIDQLEEPITSRESKAEKEAERLAKKDRTLINAEVKKNIARNKQEGKLTPGEEAVDKKFAPEYIEWEAGGGAEKLQKDLSTLDAVVAKLEDPNSDVTGKIIGSTPEWMRGFTNPEAQDVHDNIRQVIQQSLRITLGAQFTEKEGERVINASYNPKLSPEVNAKRVKALLNQLQKTARAKQAAVEYYRNNRNSLRGFKKPTDLENDFLESIGLGKESKGEKGASEETAQAPAQESNMKVIDVPTFEKIRQNPNNQQMFLQAIQAEEQRIGRPLTPQEKAQREMEVLKANGISVQR